MMLVSQIIFYSIVIFGIGFIMSTCGKFLFEAARKFRRREHTHTNDSEEHRCNCSQANENNVESASHINQGYVFTISGRRVDRNTARIEPPPAFSEVIKDDKDLPKYEEVMDKPHLYRIE